MRFGETTVYPLYNVLDSVLILGHVCRSSTIPLITVVLVQP